MTSTQTTVSLALGAALLALSACASTATKAPAASGKVLGANDTVHCYNINSCKGTSDCKTASTSCKGQNACKGQGFKATSAKGCFTQGGVAADL